MYVFLGVEYKKEQEKGENKGTTNISTALKNGKP